MHGWLRERRWDASHLVVPRASVFTEVGWGQPDLEESVRCSVSPTGILLSSGSLVVSLRSYCGPKFLLPILLD